MSVSSLGLIEIPPAPDAKNRVPIGLGFAAADPVIGKVQEDTLQIGRVTSDLIEH
jgi:hypothetical protein